MNRSAMSLDLPASLSRPNVIREDLPKHHLVIIKAVKAAKEPEKTEKKEQRPLRTSKDKRSRGWGVLLNRGRIKPN